MYIVIEENPNCPTDERVFPNSGETLFVKKVHLAHPETNTISWCDIVAVSESGSFTKALAQRVEDSSDGTAWLIYGGEWGLRIKPAEPSTPWSLTDKTQWGVPFLVLDSSGSSIEFE